MRQGDVHRHIVNSFVPVFFEKATESIDGSSLLVTKTRAKGKRKKRKEKRDITGSLVKDRRLESKSGRGILNGA